mmetsp:Transcript_37875/g.100649  ORF Transcript_37875/g.100649 Transcript_37875/m.100649 type:complete len:290 (-) Transcript_37875:1623-2492(-)
MNPCHGHAHVHVPCDMCPCGMCPCGMCRAFGGPIRHAACAVPSCVSSRKRHRRVRHPIKQSHHMHISTPASIPPGLLGTYATCAARSWLQQDAPHQQRRRATPQARATPQRRSTPGVVLRLYQSYGDGGDVGGGFGFALSRYGDGGGTKRPMALAAWLTSPAAYASALRSWWVAAWGANARSSSSLSASDSSETSAAPLSALCSSSAERARFHSRLDPLEGDSGATAPAPAGTPAGGPRAGAAPTGAPWIGAPAAAAYCFSAPPLDARSAAGRAYCGLAAPALRWPTDA